MSQTIETMVQELHAAIDLLDRKRVNELCEALIAEARRGEQPFPLALAKQAMSHLRRKRFFAQMQRLAEAVIQSEQPEPQVRRQYAQALIDQGMLTAAAAILRELLDDPAERTEVRGLLGRVHKQRYVDAVPCARGGGGHGPARNAEVLRQAIGFYHEPFAESAEANFWHGINAVACAARARRDGVADPTVADPERIAGEVLARIRAKGDAAGAWELATALEACVALGDDAAAIGWAVRYTRRTDADAFEIASTLRQLEEVWCLDSTGGMGREILPLLRGALLQRETGSIEVTPAEVREAVRHADEPGRDRKSLEKVFGTDGFMSYETFLNGARRARTVARIGREAGGRGLGTGFLVQGADMAERFKDEEWLLLTNAHVVSTEEEHQPAVFPDEAVITFQALPPGSAQKSYRVKEVLGVSGPAQLDFALLKLEGSVADLCSDDRCEVAKRLPNNNREGRVYIIGHPGGGSLSYSIQDNLLLDHESPWLHYRTPTEGGSSGSPVYNAEWKLIGLHHAGSHEMPRLRGQPGTYEANEGIWIQAIRQALA